MMTRGGGRLPRWVDAVKSKFHPCPTPNIDLALMTHVSATPRPARARSGRALSGTCRPPGDKSISHRGLIFSALANGESVVSGLLEGDDVLCTAKAMAALGAEVERVGEGQWRVKGCGANGFAAPAEPLDFGNSGTGVRLAFGAVAGHGVEVKFVGDASLSGRPMERVLEPLRAMGAAAWSSDGKLPVTVKGRPPLRPTAWISKVASAQVKSAVLLAGLAADGVTEFVEPRASRDHTEKLLGLYGVNVESDSDGAAHWRRISGPAELKPTDVTVPADPSSAMFLAVAALITDGSAIMLSDVMANPTRSGGFETLLDMGAALEMGGDRVLGAEEAMDIVVRASALKGIEIPPERAPSQIDEYPILAVAAAFAEGRTIMRGLAELRVKESDRIAATAALLRDNRVPVEELEDGLIIYGCGKDGVPGGGRVTTHGDHRIAMSALVLGLGAQEPVEIDDAAMIATSYPNFFEQMTELGADVEAGAASGAEPAAS